MVSIKIDIHETDGTAEVSGQQAGAPSPGTEGARLSLVEVTDLRDAGPAPTGDPVTGSPASGSPAPDATRATPPSGDTSAGPAPA